MTLRRQYVPDSVVEGSYSRGVPNWPSVAAQIMSIDPSGISDDTSAQIMQIPRRRVRPLRWARVRTAWNPPPSPRAHLGERAAQTLTGTAGRRIGDGRRRRALGETPAVFPGEHQIRSLGSGWGGDGQLSEEGRGRAEVNPPPPLHAHASPPGEEENPFHLTKAAADSSGK